MTNIIQSNIKGQSLSSFGRKPFVYPKQEDKLINKDKYVGYYYPLASDKRTVSFRNWIKITLLC